MHKNWRARYGCLLQLELKFAKHRTPWSIHGMGSHGNGEGEDTVLNQNDRVQPCKTVFFSWICFESMVMTQWVPSQCGCVLFAGGMALKLFNCKRELSQVWKTQILPLVSWNWSWKHCLTKVVNTGYPWDNIDSVVRIKLKDGLKDNDVHTFFFNGTP